MDKRKKQKKQKGGTINDDNELLGIINKINELPKNFNDRSFKLLEMDNKNDFQTVSNYIEEYKDNINEGISGKMDEYNRLTNQIINKLFSKKIEDNKIEDNKIEDNKIEDNKIEDNKQKLLNENKKTIDEKEQKINEIIEKINKLERDNTINNFSIVEPNRNDIKNLEGNIDNFYNIIDDEDKENYIILTNELKHLLFSNEFPNKFFLDEKFKKIIEKINKLPPENKKKFGEIFISGEITKINLQRAKRYFEYYEKVINDNDKKKYDKYIEEILDIIYKKLNKFSLNFINSNGVISFDTIIINDYKFSMNYRFDKNPDINFIIKHLNNDKLNTDVNAFLNNNEVKSKNEEDEEDEEEDEEDDEEDDEDEEEDEEDDEEDDEDEEDEEKEDFSNFKDFINKQTGEIKALELINHKLFDINGNEVNINDYTERTNFNGNKPPIDDKNSDDGIKYDGNSDDKINYDNLAKEATEIRIKIDEEEAKANAKAKANNNYTEVVDKDGNEVVDEDGNKVVIEKQKGWFEGLFGKGGNKTTKPHKKTIKRKKTPRKKITRKYKNAKKPIL
jgi:hypothetical protein